ncbi:MAG: tRNA (adenosine(37)-N6)-threonylcarbamoyltransferase complex dimerization subunit type 1 TsaB [Ignavibacteriales bacterium]|nr:tRNA (adenosine(37)-N6)-threonylcarbamoyltransferase complex dimerization subunit type 1 TsaB [Ignavibacteriales bacterium]
MTVLGIETTTDVCGVALNRNGVQLDSIVKNEKHIHAAQLVPMIENLLSRNQLKVFELDGIAVSIGPGSFTGLRIGLSVAKGLAYSSHLPLAAVSTLQSLAYPVWKTIPATESIILSVTEIQRDEFAYALFRAIDFIENHVPDFHLITKNEKETVEKIFENPLHHFLLCGFQAEKFYSMFCSENRNVSFAGKEFNACSATSIASLGERYLERNVIADVSSLEPVYGKNFIAKKSNLFSRITQ